MGPRTTKKNIDIGMIIDPRVLEALEASPFSLLLTRYPRVVFFGSFWLVTVGAVNLGFAALVNEHARPLLVVGILSGIGGLLTTLSGFVYAMARMRSEDRNRDRIAKADLHERELKQSLAIAQAELAQRERLQEFAKDFANQLTNLTAMVESLKRAPADPDPDPDRHIDPS